jgi:hypothetical protein
MMIRILLVALLLCVSFSTTIFGQNLSPSSIPGGGSAPSGEEDSAVSSLVSNLPSIQGLKAGKILLNPYVQLGYQTIGANMSIPVSGAPAGPNQLFIGTIDVTLTDFDFWSGTAGLNVVVAPITLVGSIGGFAPGLFRMSGLIPISSSAASVVPDLVLTGSHFEFWTAQLGASFSFSKDFSILGGYLWSHTAAEFTDPRVGSVPIANQTLRGDMLMNLGVPYIGIQVMQQGYYRGALLYSPLARSSGALSLQAQAITPPPALVDLRYSLSQPGTFLAINAEYYLPIPPPVILSLWFAGTYVNIKGSSDLEFTTAGPALSITRDVTITNTQYGLAGGGSFGLVF